MTTDEAEEEEAASSSNEDDEVEGEEEGETDAGPPAELDDEDDENDECKPEGDVSLLRHQHFKKKKTRLSRTVEYSSGAVTDSDIDDSSTRLRRLEARRKAQQERHDDMPYNFNNPFHGVTDEQQKSIDNGMTQLDSMKKAAPVMYQKFCLNILRHYRDGRPI